MKEESYIRNVKYFLEELIRGCGIIQKENPAVQFTKDAKAGLYDNYTDEVYNSMEAAFTASSWPKIWLET